MRSFASLSVGMVLGAVLGVLLSSHLWIRATRLLREATIAEYQFEQEMLASQAQRRGDQLARLIHSASAANSQAGIGFQWLIRSRKVGYWEWFTFPWEDFLESQHLDRHWWPPPPFEPRVEAILSARAAIALEQIGLDEYAIAEWERADRLHPEMSADQLRDLAAGSGIPEELASAYLESQSPSDLGSRLKELRESWDR